MEQTVVNCLWKETNKKKKSLIQVKQFKADDFVENNILNPDLFLIILAFSK